MRKAALEGVKQTNNLSGVFKLGLGDGLVYGLLCHPQRHSERLHHAVLCKQTRPLPSLPRVIFQVKPIKSSQTKDVMSTTALRKEVERWLH